MIGVIEPSGKPRIADAGIKKLIFLSLLLPVPIMASPRVLPMRIPN